MELGAYWSVKSKNIDAFQRYMSQLQPIYTIIGMACSVKMYPLQGLYLLYLLSANKIAEFHTQLELIDPSQLSNPYIKHPIALEQFLMEGAYNRVWKARKEVPTEEYLLFMDILMETVRYLFISDSLGVKLQVAVKSVTQIYL